VADLADDVRTLLDDLGVDRVDWCGLSLGAMVGMYLAAEHPERIGRLVLCCTSAHFPDPTVWHDRITAVSAGGTASIARAVVDRWFTPGWAAAHPDTVAEARAMVAGTSDEGYIGCCAALAVWDHRNRLQAITAPTLVVRTSQPDGPTRCSRISQVDRADRAPPPPPPRWPPSASRAR
jgi:3-oxoadipate enol-lactonase